jgi:hypothetical protein
MEMTPSLVSIPAPPSPPSLPPSSYPSRLTKPAYPLHL